MKLVIDSKELRTKAFCDLRFEAMNEGPLDWELGVQLVKTGCSILIVIGYFLSRRTKSGS